MIEYTGKTEYQSSDYLLKSNLGTSETQLFPVKFTHTSKDCKYDAQDGGGVAEFPRPHSGKNMALCEETSAEEGSCSFDL